MTRAGTARAVLALATLAGCGVPRPVSPPPRSAPPPAAPRQTEPPEARRFAFEGAASQGGMMIGTAPTRTRRLTLDGEAVPLAADGRFVIAFDRDAGPQARLIATRDDGGTIVETLAIAPRAWRVERLDRLPRFARPSDAFARTRAVELSRIAAARRIDSASDGWRQRFQWPATGRISGLFGAQRVYRGEAGAYHSGVDIARPTGTPVVAPADAVVVLAADAPFTLEGRLLMLDHGMGLGSAFLHLSRIDVAPGQRVRRGEPIGAVGATGRATGPHLHWGMTWRGRRIDPLLIAGPMADGPNRP